jgi:WD40 repeat protein
MNRHTLSLFLLALALSLSSCQESNTEPVDTITFNMSKNKIMLTRSMPMDSSILFLSCGCKYTLSIESFTGDTSVIHYTERDARNNAYRVALDVTADTNAVPGNYAARIAVLSWGYKGEYRDTLSVEYTRN